MIEESEFICGMEWLMPRGTQITIQHGVGFPNSEDLGYIIRSIRPNQSECCFLISPNMYSAYHCNPFYFLSQMISFDWGVKHNKDLKLELKSLIESDT